MRLVEKIEANIRQFDLIPLGSRVLLAISGGVDSMVLWDALYRLAVAHQWSLEIAHFNHLLRQPDSEADEEFVRLTATRMELAFHAERRDVRDFARENGLSLEMAGRELRHRFLAQTAERAGIGCIALGHHADDQVETFWLRLLRGDVGPGAAGMPWKRPSVVQSVQLVRPLLNIWRAEIEQYAKDGGITFRQDATNFDVRFQRNRFRHEILPVLERYQPEIREITLRSAEVLREEKEFLRRTASDWLNKFHPPFSELDPAAQREVIRLQLAHARHSPTFDLIEGLRCFPNRPVTVAPGVQILRTLCGRIERAPKSDRAFCDDKQRISVGARGESVLGDLRVNWALVPHQGPPEQQVESFDADAVGSPITLRYWRPGDRFHPIGATQPTKLQDIFTNLKIPAQQRRSRVLAVAENGEIFWVEGLRIGERFKVVETTRQILKWSWHRRAN